MPLADFLGWNHREWMDTIGLVAVFFIGFPLLVHAIIGYIVAQVLGEKRANQALMHGDDQTSQG